MYPNTDPDPNPNTTPNARSEKVASEHTIRKTKKQPTYPWEDPKHLIIASISENGCESRDKKERPTEYLFREYLE